MGPIICHSRGIKQTQIVEAHALDEPEIDSQSGAGRNPSRPGLFLPGAVLAVLVVGLTLYSNSVALISDPQYYQYYPPFETNRNRRMIEHLGAEYWNIAQALHSGRGFSDPFFEETGPTAWMPPALSYFLAGLLWLFGGKEEPVAWFMVFCQSLTWILTGWMALWIGTKTWGPRSRWYLVALFLLFLLQNFHLAFQITHDPWLLMLGLDLLLLGYLWLKPSTKPSTATSSQKATWGIWGVMGGLLALCSPVLGLVWLGLGLLLWSPFREFRTWLMIGTLSLLVISPWIVRNYQVFGRFIPIKSNAFYELFQSQKETPDGLVRNWAGFETHPYKTGRQRDEYRQWGEQAFLEKKKAEFLALFWADPGDFVQRVWNRFAGATLVYVPMEKYEESLPPSVKSLFPRIMQPLPLLAIAILLIFPQKLNSLEWGLVTIFALWLFPYVVVSYYDRYGFPLMGIKILLCFCAMDRIMALVINQKKTVNLTH